MVERAARREDDLATVTRAVSNVLVGCNLPAGLVLQLFDMVPGREMTPQGPKETKIARKKGPPVTLKGIAVPFGRDRDFPMMNGYAVTTVDAQFWRDWCEQNSDADVLANKCLIAGADTDDIQAKTREAKQAKVRSGLEPIDPKRPPPVGGKVTPLSNSMN